MDVLLTLHSLWRWVVLIMILAAVVVGLLGWLGRRQWSPAAAALGRLTPIAIDMQVLLGIALWIAEARWNINVYYSIIHPVLGLAVLAVAHVISARIKRSASDQGRYRLLALGYLLVAVGVYITIPAGRWFVRGL